MVVEHVVVDGDGLAAEAELVEVAKVEIVQAGGWANVGLVLLMMMKTAPFLKNAVRTPETAFHIPNLMHQNGNMRQRIPIFHA